MRGAIRFAGLSCLWALAIHAQAPPSAGTVVSELREHRAADALRDVDSLLKSYPNDAKLWTLKGIAAKQLGNTKSALTAFESALKISPNYLPALEGAVEIAYRSDPARARVLVDRLLTEVPTEPNANGIAAMLDYQSKQWPSAVEHFQKSGPAIENQHSALLAYAISLARLKRTQEAEGVLQTILNKWPEDKSSRYNLAVLQSQDLKYDDAIATLQPLLDQHDEPSLSLAATIYEAQRETPKAVAALREAIQQKPKDPQNYLDFAAISFDHSSFTAGIVMLNAGLTQLPDSAALYVARGILYMQTSQVEEAERDFETANRLDPSQSFGMEAEGLTQVQRHDLPRALADVERSLQHDPRNAYLNYMAAEILKEQGAGAHSESGRKAMTYVERAVALDPKLVAARNLQAALALQAGDLELAAQQSRAVLQQDATNQEAVYRLMLILRRGGDKGHEVPGLVERLKQLRADEHSTQVKIDHYKLTTAESSPEPPTQQ